MREIAVVAAVPRNRRATAPPSTLPAAEAGRLLVEVPVGGTLPGVAARRLRKCDGAARGVEARPAARPARLLPPVGRLLARVTRPGARVAAGHPRTLSSGAARRARPARP